jgi:Fe-S-cluster-containing dehydrogenase component
MERIDNMGRKGLLFDMEYCTGCQACTVACKQENDYDADTWGIIVKELILTHPSGHVQIDYLPFPTTLCTLCTKRIASGFDSRPACVKCCQSSCIEYGDVEDLYSKMQTMKRPVLYSPKG